MKPIARLQWKLLCRTDDFAGGGGLRVVRRQGRYGDRLGRIATKADVPAGTKLVVAEQNATQSLPWNLANAGKDAPYGVEFADFSGGAAVIEALRSGAADIGSIGEAPVPIAVDSGVTDLVTIGLQANPGTSGGYFLVAKPTAVSPGSRTFAASGSHTRPVPVVT